MEIALPAFFWEFMGFDSEIHHRRSIRLKGYDYSGPGAYFITMCVQDRECIFGSIEDQDMVLNPCGEIVRDEWLRTPILRNNVILDAFVIMPNHFHALFIISDVGAYGIRPKNTPDGLDMNPCCLGPEQICPGTNQWKNGLFEPVNQNDHLQKDGGVCHTPLRSPSRTVGAIIRGFKSVCTKRINALEHCYGRKLWQRNYWEHIIRNQREMDRFREYILTNPQRWSIDPLNKDIM